MSEEHIHANAHLDARPKTEELGSLLTSLLAPTRQEQGCVRFELQQNRDSLTEFAIVRVARQGRGATSHRNQLCPACVAQVAGPLRRISDSTVWWADVGRTADITNVTQFPLSEILP
jgi:quinol monooxygenase YgiN